MPVLIRNIAISILLFVFGTSCLILSLELVSRYTVSYDCAQFGNMIDREAKSVGMTCYVLNNNNQWKTKLTWELNQIRGGH